MIIPSGASKKDLLAVFDIAMKYVEDQASYNCYLICSCQDDAEDAIKAISEALENK